MDQDTEHSLELIRALDEAIAKGHWEGGLFFQAAGKKLRDLSERLKKELNFEDEKHPSPTKKVDWWKPILRFIVLKGITSLDGKLS
jgi:hypothetical protein